MNTIENKISEIIEQDVWLSKSIIWKQLGEFYQQEGITAWHNTVPYQVTSNPRIAASYCEMILSFLEDWISQHGKFSGPCNIVEMGTGHGSFSLMMLRTLEKFRQDFDLLGVKINYIMTDLAASNVEAWRNDIGLSPYIKSGTVKVAVFDCLEQEELSVDGTLVGSGDAPCIFIANYLFDTLPQEAFSFYNGTILRAKAMVRKREKTIEYDPDKWELNLEFQEFSREDLSVTLNGLLEEYRKIKLQGCLLLPSGAFQCIENIRNISRDRFLLLCSDKALSTQNSINNRSTEEITHFVSVSMIVNFHSLRLYFQHEGGCAWTQQTQQEYLASAAFSFGTDQSGMRRTERTFSNHLDRQSPGDLYSLSTQLLSQRFNMSVGGMISFLKLFEWDAAIFETLYDALLSRLPHATANEVADLMNTLPLIAERRYPLPGSADTLFLIAHLLQCMQRYPSAIELYLSRIEEHGESPDISYNLGLCYYAIGELELSKTAFLRATILNPDLLAAQGWLYRLTTAGTLAVSDPA
jgi:tetratricopeptide (TPR) repeat protein